jgi:hypothetical protein
MVDAELVARGYRGDRGVGWMDGGTTGSLVNFLHTILSYQYSLLISTLILVLISYSYSLFMITE